MAKELSRHFNTAQRVVILHVEDDFGNVSHHTIPLTGDSCPHCGFQIHEGGSRDIEVSVQKILAHVDKAVDDVLPHFEKAGMDVSAIRAKRNGH